MNSATAQTKPRTAAAKRLAPSDPFAVASLRIDATKKIFFADDLRHRWERIVQGDLA